MSSTSVGETPATETAPADLPSLAANSDSPYELAPSETAKEEPSFARIVGMIGGFAAFLGGAGLLANHLDWKQLISSSAAVTFLVFGLVAMLYHAARDGEQEIRRTYGFFALGLLVLSIILGLTRGTIFPFSALGLFSALAFLSFFLRHETELNWSKPFRLILGIVGFSLVVLLLWWVFANRSQFVSSGIVVGFLALGYLCALMSQFGSTSDDGRTVALGIAGIGVAMLGYAVIAAIANSDKIPLFPVGIIVGFIGGVYLIVALGVLSDIPLIVLVRKEIASYFYSPVAYFILIGMTAIGLFNFVTFVSRLYMPPLGRPFNPLGEPLIGVFIFGVAGWIAPLCIVPLLTMRLLSEEKRTGTYEVLMSLPISEISVVLSKFIAGLIIFMVMWIPWGAFLLGLQGELDKPFDYRPILTFEISLLFTGASFISMGLFFSSLTRNQIIAAVLTFAGMLFLLLMILFAGSRGGSSPLWQQIFLKLSFLRVWEDSVYGTVPLHDLVLFASITVFWLFLTVKSLETRRWN